MVNPLYSSITVVILILLVMRQISVWKYRVFLSPGFYFGAFWIFGVFGVSLFSMLDMIPMTYPEYVDELNILIGFTGLCFLLYTSWGRKKINQDAIVVNFTTQQIFNILSVILLLAAVADFLRLGGQFNMGAAREALHENQASRPAWIGYIETLSLPLSVMAGYKIATTLMHKTKLSIANKIFLILPLVANFFFSVSVGGRVHFVYAFITYLIGCSLAMPMKLRLSQLKKPIIMLTIAIVLVISFISMVAAQRSQYYLGRVDEKQAYFESKYGALGFLYGPVEYMVASFIGYQYRRYDAVDLNELGYGQYTFNGFINWTIPFSGQLGLEDLSIAKTFDIYYDNQETYDFERMFYFTTHSCYIPLVKDFGTSYMLYIVIALLTYISHYLFVQIQRRSVIRNACSIFLYYIFWNYWVKSNYYGTLSSTVLVPLYGFIIIDLVSHIFVRKTRPRSIHFDNDGHHVI